MKKNLYCLFPLSNFVQPSTPPSPTLPLASFWCLISLVGYVIAQHLMCQFTVELHLPSLIMSSSLKVWHRWSVLLIHWFDIPHSNNTTAHTQTNRQILTYKYILTSPGMCSKQLPALEWMNNSQSKIYFTQVYIVFDFQKLLTYRSYMTAWNEYWKNGVNK